MTILHQDFIQSSMLSSCDYNTENKELSVIFTGGKKYEYVDVDKDIYTNLVNAQSAGKYFNSIKNGLTQK